MAKGSVRLGSQDKNGFSFFPRCLVDSFLTKIEKDGREERVEAKTLVCVAPLDTKSRLLILCCAG